MADGRAQQSSASALMLAGSEPRGARASTARNQGSRGDARQPKPRIWQWWTMLSLDAPLVAVGWQAVLAHDARAALTWQARVLLAWAVWLAYVADRLLDARKLDPARPSTARHSFYRRRTAAVLPVWLVVLVAGAALALSSLSVARCAAGALLVVVAAVYVTFGARRSLPHRGKEACAALLFSAGAAFFCVDSSASSVPLLVGSLLLSALALLNLLFIAEREHVSDRAQGFASPACRRPAARMLQRAACALSAGGALLLVSTELRATALSLALGAACLGLLVSIRRQLSLPAARAGADLALLAGPVAVAILEGF